MQTKTALLLNDKNDSTFTDVCIKIYRRLSTRVYLEGVSIHDQGVLIYLKSILLSLSHRFDSFAPANMLHDSSRFLRLLRARWQRPKKPNSS